MTQADKKNSRRIRLTALLTILSITFLLFTLSACSNEEAVKKPREEEAVEIIDSYFADGKVEQTTPFQMPEEQANHDESVGVHAADELIPYEELYVLDSGPPIESYTKLEQLTDVQALPVEKIV